MTALLLLSCSERTEREVSRGDVARVEAPVKAHVESINLDGPRDGRLRVARLGWGRRLDRCSERTATESRCTLVVERDRPARARARCAEGTTKLEVDPRGERFAVADDERWRSGPGFSGELATTQPSVASRASGPVDWSAVPSAREIVRKELAWWLGYESRSMRNAALFENLLHLAPEHMGEDLVTLAADDSIDRSVCSSHLLLGRRLREAARQDQAEVQAKLAPALVGPFDPAAPPPPVRHAARVLHGKALLGAVGSPERYLERAGTSPVAAAAVLQAWSQTAPIPPLPSRAGRCRRSGERARGDAAFAAIAHARLACPAALARKPRWCGELGRVYAPDDDQKDVKPDTVFCEPYEGFDFAQRLGNPSFDHQAFGRICRTGPDASEDDDERKNDD